MHVARPTRPVVAEVAKEAVTGRALRAKESDTGFICAKRISRERSIPDASMGDWVADPNGDGAYACIASARRGYDDEANDGGPNEVTTTTPNNVTTATAAAASA